MAAPPALQLSSVHLAGGLGDSNVMRMSFRIATACDSLAWFRFEFLSWSHRDAWVPVWGAKGIYLRTIEPIELATAHEHHQSWLVHIAHANPELTITTELTLPLITLRSSN